MIPAHVRNYTVTAIYDNAFVGEILRSLTIPSSVREVGSGIFEATQIDTVYLKSTTPPVLKIRISVGIKNVYFAYRQKV